MLTDVIGRTLDMDPQDLEKASLRAYLESRRRHFEAQRFQLAKKRGIRTVQEFDAAIRDGKTREADGFEDFFTLDHLETELAKIQEALRSLS